MEVAASRPARYCGVMVKAHSQQTMTPQKRRGPAPTGKGEPITVRLQPEQVTALDEWIARQPAPLSRPEAIRHALAEFLGRAPKA
jgi:hypothetical protein